MQVSKYSKEGMKINDILDQIIIDDIFHTYNGDKDENKISVRQDLVVVMVEYICIQKVLEAYFIMVL